MLTFKANPGATRACVLLRGAEFVLHWLHPLFIPLNSKKAVLGLPKTRVQPRGAVNAPLYGREKSPVWAPCPVTLSLFTSPRDCPRTDHLLPALQGTASLRVGTDTIRGHHPGDTRGQHWHSPCSTCWREFAEASASHPSVSPVAFLETVKSWRRKQKDSHRTQQCYSLERNLT